MFLFFFFRKVTLQLPLSKKKEQEQNEHNYRNCAHFIAACLISKRLSDDTKEFVTVKARGRPKLTKGALKK